MNCSTKGVYAPNGRRSQLYADLLTEFKNENTALQMWSSIHTPAFKELYGDWKSEDYTGKLDANGEPMISDIVTSEALQDNQVMEQAEIDTKDYNDSLTSVINKLGKARDIIVRRIVELERSDTEGAKKFKGNLVKLKKELDKLKKKKDNIDWRDSILKFTRTANTSIKFITKGIDQELAKTEPNSQRLFRLRSQLKAFDVLSDLQSELTANDRLAEMFDKSEIAKMSELILSKNSALRKHDKYMNNRIADKLSKLSNKHDAQAIKELLERAPTDITGRERWLRFAGDSKDSVIALVAKIVNEQQQATRHSAIEFTRTLSDKLQAMEEERSEFKGNAEKMYSPMLVKGKDGNLTNYIITEEHHKEQYDEFKSRYKGTKTFEFYEHFINEYKRLNDKLPAYSQMGNRIPTLLKSTIERVLSSEDKLNQVVNHARNKIEKTNTDTETGQMLDDTNRAVDSIPIHFTQSFDTATQRRQYKKLLKEGLSEREAEKKSIEYAKAQLAKDISYDLGASLQAFQYMAENYANMSEIIDVVEGAKDRLYERSMTVNDSKGNPIITRMKDFMGDSLSDNKQQIKGAESNAYKMIESFIAAQVYGQSEIDLGNFNFLNMQIDNRKLTKLLGSYNSYLLLGTNVLAGTANILMGETMQWADAFGGEFYSVKDYLKASNEYRKQLPSILEDVASRTPVSKVGLFSEYYDFLGDYFPGGVGATDASAMRRVAKSGSLFFMNNVGEHLMQNRAAISIFLATDTFNKDGKKIGNLWEAHHAEKGKLKIDDVFIKDSEGNLVKYDQGQKNNMSRKIQALLRRMHGNYNSQTAAAWQRHGVYNLVGQFRKWIADGFARRWGRGYYNEFVGQDVEGAYRSTGKFLAGLMNDVFNTSFQIGKNWNDMTTHEKANVWRTTTEASVVVGMALSLAVLGKLMEGLDEEEDRDKLAGLRFNAYLANRLMAELLFYSDFGMSAYQILKSPAASMSVLETTGRTMYYGLPWNWDERYESGVHKDKRKLTVSLGRQIPVWKQVERTSPEGLKTQLSFFNF